MTAGVGVSDVLYLGIRIAGLGLELQAVEWEATCRIDAHAISNGVCVGQALLDRWRHPAPGVG